MDDLYELLGCAVDALEAALYSEDEKRLDAAEETFEELEKWLVEHPVPRVRPRRKKRKATHLRAPSSKAHRFDLKLLREDEPDYSG